MRIKALLAVTALFFAGTAVADLEIYKDYDISDAVWSVTTVKVDSNMGDAYLEGLQHTWAAGNEVSVKLGQMESYTIYVSDLPASGEFNLLLVVKFANSSDLAPNQKRYQAFMKEWGEARGKESIEFAQKNFGFRINRMHHKLKQARNFGFKLVVLGFGFFRCFGFFDFLFVTQGKRPHNYQSNLPQIGIMPAINQV